MAKKVKKYGTGKFIAALVVGVALGSVALYFISKQKTADENKEKPQEE